MSKGSDTDGNSMIPSSQSKGEAGLPSHRGDWMKIQQSAKDGGNVPPTTVPAKAVARPPDNVLDALAQKKSSGGSSEWGCILIVLGFALLLIMWLFFPPDRSYRKKMTPEQKYYDDLREEQEFYENRGPF